MAKEIPSLAALESNEGRPLHAELRLVRLRSQAAVVRALADHVEHLSRAADAEGLGLQIIEEMARIGRCLLEATGALAEAPPAEDSGVFARVDGVQPPRAGS
jgi:hypothetical protein